MKIAPLKYPLDAHPGMMKHESAAHGAQTLLDAVTAINEALAKVNDPRSLTKAIKEKAANAAKSAVKARDYAHAASQSKAKLMKDQIAKRSEFEKETRDLIRANKSPATLIRQFIAAGDADAVGAVFRAPPYLTGLTDEQFGVLYTYARQTLTPDLYQQEQDADAAVARLSRGIEVFNSEVQRIDKALSGSDENIAANLLKKPEPADAA